MIDAALKDSAFLESVAMARKDPQALHLWWLGQSGFLVQHNGRHLLFDPYLSDSLTLKYATTDKQHVRMTERVVDPSRLDFIDVVTSTHNHTDHLDGETLRPLMAANPEMRLVISEANRDFVCDRLECEEEWPVGINAGQSAEVCGFTFHTVPAAHEEIERDEHGRCRFVGYIVRFGEWTLYHSGDTVLYEGMEDLLRPFEIDIAFLPINGAKPERKVSGNLNGKEAAELAMSIGARVVIPCHYDMFEFNTESPQLFEETCLEIGQRYAVLRAGETWSSSEGGAQ